MNLQSVDPEENKKFAELCLRIIAVAEKTRDFQSQCSLDVVQSIKLMDSAKISEVALSAFISSWQSLGKGGHPDKVKEILDGLPSFTEEVSDAISLLKKSAKLLESLWTDFKDLKDYVEKDGAGEISKQAVAAFLGQTIESVKNEGNLLEKYQSSLESVQAKLPYMLGVYQSNTIEELVSRVMLASIGITAINERFFGSEEESEENPETPTPEESANIRKAVAMMSKEFKKKQNG